MSRRLSATASYATRPTYGYEYNNFSTAAPVAA